MLQQAFRAITLFGFLPFFPATWYQVQKKLRDVVGRKHKVNSKV